MSQKPLAVPSISFPLHFSKNCVASILKAYPKNEHSSCSSRSKSGVGGGSSSGNSKDRGGLKGRKCLDHWAALYFQALPCHLLLVHLSEDEEVAATMMWVWNYSIWGLCVGVFKGRALQCINECTEQTKVDFWYRALSGLVAMS